MVVLAVAAALLYGAYASVEWEGGGYAWLLILTAILVAGGYRWRRWKALFWIGVAPWLTLSVLSDAAWMTGIWDRSDEYEPLPTTMFLVPFGLPVTIGLVALGVAVGKAREAPQGASDP